MGPEVQQVYEVKEMVFVTFPPFYSMDYVSNDLKKLKVMVGAYRNTSCKTNTCNGSG